MAYVQVLGVGFEEVSKMTPPAYLALELEMGIPLTMVNPVLIRELTKITVT